MGSNSAGVKRMSFLFGRRVTTPDAQIVGERLHDDLVAAIRQPVFYLRFGVPDTFEGRFDLLVLHVSVVLRHLGRQGAAGEAVAQRLVDTMFARFDVAMRELGVSDIGVPKRMKRLAQAFRGRTTAYHAALETEDETALRDAIERNVLNGSGQALDLARHTRRMDAALAGVDLTAPGGRLPVLPESIEA